MEKGPGGRGRLLARVREIHADPFGAVTQLLNEVYHPPGSVFNTSSVRNIYSPEVTVAKELMVDQVANAMGQDPCQFRRSFVRDPRMLAVLNAAAQAANWGKRMAPLTAVSSMRLARPVRLAPEAPVIRCTALVVRRAAPAPARLPE